MKLKALFAAAVVFAACAFACVFAGCSKKVDYNLYVSERRNSVYVYADDDVSITIYCSQKEQPYAADGYRGNVSDLTEIFVKLSKSVQKLQIDANGLGGEMNYSSVDKNYYLSFSAPDFNADSVQVILTADGSQNSYTAQNVKSGNVLSCSEALACVVEHDRELFLSLTANGLFNGEIFVRLLYDEGCYYYVGVCDKQGNITAYLLDGERGKIIAKKQLHS